MLKFIIWMFNIQGRASYFGTATSTERIFESFIFAIMNEPEVLGLDRAFIWIQGPQNIKYTLPS